MIRETLAVSANQNSTKQDVMMRVQAISINNGKKEHKNKISHIDSIRKEL